MAESDDIDSDTDLRPLYRAAPTGGPHGQSSDSKVDGDVESGTCGITGMRPRLDGQLDNIGCAHRARVASLPERLFVHMDNAPSDNKNQAVFGLLAAYVMRGVFRRITVLFGLVGHTHNCVDCETE